MFRTIVFGAITPVLALDTPLSLALVRSLTTQFFAWWQEELASLLLSAHADGTADTLTLAFDDTGWTIQGREPSTTAFLPADAPETEVADALRLKAMKMGARRLAISLPATRAMLRHLELPILAKLRLHDAVALQLPRLSPKAPDAIAWHIAALPNSANNGRTTYAIALLSKDDDARLRHVADLSGIVLDGIDVATPDGPALRFPIERAGLAARAWGSLWFRLGLMAVIVLWIVSLLFVSSARDAQLATLEARRDTLRAEVAALPDMSSDLEERKTARDAVAALLTPPTRLDALNRLTTLLGDDVRLQTMRITSSQIALTGRARDATQLPGLIEADSMFKDAAFSAPLDRRAGEAEERFTLTATFE